MKLKNLLVKHLIPLLLIAILTISMGTSLGKYVKTLPQLSLELTINAITRDGVLMPGSKVESARADIQNGNTHKFFNYDESQKMIALMALFSANRVTYDIYFVDQVSDDIKNSAKHVNTITRNDWANDAVFSGNWYYGSVSEIPSDDTVRMYFDYASRTVYIVSTGGGKIYANKDSSNLFHLTSVKTLDFTNLDFSNVEDASGMFSLCPSLTTIDITGWDMSKVKKADEMFYGSPYLQTIYASSSLPSKASSTNMFYQCDALKGKAGSKTYSVFDVYYSELMSGSNNAQANATSGKYARVATTNQAGYFTAKTRMMMFSPAPATEPTVYEPLINQYFQSEAALPAGAVQEEYNLYRLEFMPSDFTLREWQGQLSAAADEGFSFYGWRVIYGSGSEVCSHDQLKAFLTPLYEENPSLVLEMKPLYIAE